MGESIWSVLLIDCDYSLDDDIAVEAVNNLIKLHANLKSHEFGHGVKKL